MPKSASNKTLMVQGTSSDAGKSTLVVALCRHYYRQGLAVAPFKPQNMALNSFVATDNKEIGRAQVVQAAACCLSPHADMNPILLKPTGEQTSQLIINGKAVGLLSASQYHDYKAKALDVVLQAHARLTQQYQMVIAEGAGSPAEINLRRHDIANMGFAEAVNCPVILIADISRGGVFAQMIGTLDLLSKSERGRVVGLVINKFRGAPKLLEPGIDWLEKRTGKKVLAVLPALDNAYLDGEDSLSITKNKPSTNDFTIAVIALPKMSNHTDFDPLLLHPEVTVHLVRSPAQCHASDLLILPGSRAVITDLQWLLARGFGDFIHRHLRYGGKVLGICGGYQMLGATIRDPSGSEGFVAAVSGLGLLPLDTVLMPEKKLQKTHGILTIDNAPVTGYEIHSGVSSGAALANPLLYIKGKGEGALSKDGQLAGTYLHGIFDTPAACRALLGWAGCPVSTAVDLQQERENGINLFADAWRDNLRGEFEFYP